MLLRWTTSLVIGSILMVALTACGTADGVDEAPRGAAAATATVASVPTPTASVSEYPAAPTVANSGDPTPGIAEDAACDARISSSFVMFETLNDLVWSSHQVVASGRHRNRYRAPPVREHQCGRLCPPVHDRDRCHCQHRPTVPWTAVESATRAHVWWSD